MSADHRTAVVISGAGRYADPWHDFEGTSAALAEMLSERGLDARVLRTGEVEAGQLGEPDLIVVNAGGGSTPVAQSQDAEDVRARDLRDAVLAALAAGVPVLATHTGSNTFYEHDQWAQVLGGRWVPKPEVEAGRAERASWHPPRGPAQVRLTDRLHPITAGLTGEVEIDDERYTDLEVSPDSTVLLEHEEDGRTHALVWAAEAVPGLRGRAVYDALGHDGDAVRARVRTLLLDRELAWLLS
ncbi:ThuA domain-containing protein [Ruania suaedae]|uniref:ThuA domain-containing protein n=1 Tax=Ruania suaedae TaxID=2897774 RepID=UPI001E45D65F|nr:ThuA domain-containing protein [Ruania suaedae]UFU01979.1 ThuA domain-containing protein [Ruania suaedae]